MNITKIKLSCMDLFYRCVDTDLSVNLFKDYETSFGQVFVYDFPNLSDIEKAIWSFTMVIRFARSGMLLHKNGDLERETLKSLDFVKNNSELLELNEDDRNELMKDYKEVISYFVWLKEKRED